MGVWVTKKGYSPGKRHYCEEPVVRGPGSYGRWDTTPRVFETAKAICGHAFKEEVRSPGQKYEWGGLSGVTKVNLLQSNICTHCKKRYIAARPKLQWVMDELTKAMEVEG